MALRTSKPISVPFLTGLDESYGDTNGDVSTSPFAYNIRTDYGMFAPCKGFTKHITTALPEGVTAAYVFADHEESGSEQHIIVGTETHLYVWNGTEWSAIYSTATSGDWGFVTYQNSDEVLVLIGNGVDPLLYWDGTSESASVVSNAPCKGNKFCVHFERVFCAGDPDYPDRVYYSKAFAPFDWAGDLDTPANGGGFVDIPTWDGGVITSIFTSDMEVVVAKTTAIFRLTGATPADFTIVQGAGGLGVAASNTRALSGVSHYFITEYGVATYYGGNFALLDDRKIPRIFDKAYAAPDGEDISLNAIYTSKAVGIADGQQRVMFALPLGVDAAANNAVLEYDIARQTFLLRKGFNVISFLTVGATRSQILFVGADADGDTYVYKYDDGDTLDGVAQECHWQTPWLDLTTKYARKRIAYIHMFGSVSGTLKLTIETDRARKERYVSARNIGREGAITLKTTVPGQRFRMSIDSTDGEMFKLLGGLELEVDLDE